MASDYQTIRKENEIRYGTEIGRIGPTLLADRYDDRTHFIYELLQNAEDALAKRDGESKKRSVRFDLSDSELRFSHFGKPFDENDVRSICGIAQSTKDVTEIGRFGIGFKSVYAFTDRPEVHSNLEHFAIENFVHPVGVTAVEHDTDETIIVMPLKEKSEAYREIHDGLQHLGPDALLFLREIEEIEWNVEGDLLGLYLRQSKELDDHVRCVTVIGEVQSQQKVDETWLIFSRPMHDTSGNKLVGHVEVAFRLEDNRVKPVSHSPLVVFFPTVVETNLGFRVQGPYRTTPSRDNIPRRNDWNRNCIKETGNVLVDALIWLREKRKLKVDVLQCLSLEQEKFEEDSMFFPLYEKTKQAFISHSLLPSFNKGYAVAEKAKIARTQDLRELFKSEQLTKLFKAHSQLEWLSGDISQDRTPALRRYLIQELDISEITSEIILRKIDIAFMHEQTDKWICKFYEFLNSQTALKQQAMKLPLLRLTDGRHVQAYSNDQQPQAFLPGSIETDFPTVRATTCDSNDAWEFLCSLGLAKPNPVDNVIRNILLKYKEDTPDVSSTTYDADIRLILDAFETDSQGDRERLISTLRKTSFVWAVDAGDGSRCLARPDTLYLATERLKNLFAGVKGIKLVDDDYTVLHGEPVRSLLESCGVVRYLRPVADTSLSPIERLELRKRSGYESTSYRNDQVKDFMLDGLGALLAALCGLDDVEERRERAKLLWSELIHLEERRGKPIFDGEYTWTHYGDRKAPRFDSAFVRLLKERKWVPDEQGNLQCPKLVRFESLGWQPDPFLRSKIDFKPAIIDQLAQEAGFEPGMLDLLKKLDITSEAKLRNQLNLTESINPETDSGGPTTPEEAIKAIFGDTPVPPVADLGSTYDISTGSTGSKIDAKPKPSGERTSGMSGNGSTSTKAESRSSTRSSGRDRIRSGGAPPFISYIAVHPDDKRLEPNELDHAAHMELEAKAIDFILSREPNWERTPTHNPGFDLIESGPDGKLIRWCEVKAMTGSLDDHSVGISRSQFECAREHGENYWLYIVEYANDENAQIVCIQDPAGKAQTFIFDYGWRDVAVIDSESEH